MNQTYFNRAVSGDIRSAIGLHGQRILISPNSGIVVVVLTKYQHFANQGYVLNTQLNFPDTCSARNNCPSQQPAGPEVPSYNLYELVGLVAALGEE
jgi:CubicO group peptidase (beta-lactamase class C family)